VLLGMFWNVWRVPSWSLQSVFRGPQVVKAAALDIVGAGAARAREARRGRMASESMVMDFLAVLRIRWLRVRRC
jgi:hypothetical protein